MSRTRYLNQQFHQIIILIVMVTIYILCITWLLKRIKPTVVTAKVCRVALIILVAWAC